MKLIWYCNYCKKKVEKKPVKIGNTVYIPDTVTHKHNFKTYLLHCMTFDEWMKNPNIKGY